MTMDDVEVYIKDHLEYDPSTGVIKWVKPPGFRNDLLGKEAGYLPEDGRRTIMVMGKPVRSHRVAWCLMTGSLPEMEVDHINGECSDNRWSNLREVSRTVNQQNIRRPHKDNSTGYLGVVRRGGKYRASICVRRERHFLGTYETPEEAHKAYLTAKRDLHEGCTI